VLRLAKHSKRVLGRTPSYSEIKNTLGIATKGEVARIVKSLEKRGLMRRAGRGRARRIRLP
jgi:DNA-binding MarR family transcriptional regulator